MLPTDLQWGADPAVRTAQGRRGPFGRETKPAQLTEEMVNWPEEGALQAEPPDNAEPPRYYPTANSPPMTKSILVH